MPLIRFVFFLALGLLQPVLALGGQLYVHPLGTRTEGYSQVTIWSPENCYPDIASAAGQAAWSDTLVLSHDEHVLQETVNLPAFLGDMQPGISPDRATVLCGDSASFLLATGHPGAVVEDVAFVGQGVLTGGALIQIEGGTSTGSGAVQLKDCMFNLLERTASNQVGGSCLAALGSGFGREIRIQGCTFENNAVQGLGGALYFQNGYDITIDQCLFIANEGRRPSGGGEGRGGAIAVESLLSPTRLQVSNTGFTDNLAWGPGGTLYLDEASLVLDQCRLSGSESAVGGLTAWSAGAGLFMRRQGEHAEPISLDVSRCEFLDNTGHVELNPWAGDGGAILVKGSVGRPVDVTVDQSLFQGNFSAQGAGLYMGRFATGLVSRCRFIDNSAYLQGGATFKGGFSPDNEGETAVYEYCLFDGNRAGVDEYGADSLELGRGGAFSTRLYSRAEFYNCTFNNNTAHGPSHEGDAIMLPNEGGEFSSDLRKCQLVNCVFYGEQGNSRQVVVREGALSLVSHCASEAQEIDYGGIDPIAPVLIEDYPFTNGFFPNQGSVLVDGGLDVGLTMDLSGGDVPFGAAPDIGAFESRYGYADVPGRQGSLDLKVHPNPFNPRTRVTFALAEPAAVQMEVLDVRGRRVFRRNYPLLAAGNHSLPFSGLGDDGQPLSSGQYFVKVLSNKHASVAKVTLVR